ncbi:MAG: hypothetical protein ACKOW4_04970 [Aquirufa sp.]|jgi:hypothetical protein
MNNLQSFKESLVVDKPDAQLSTILKSLWYDTKGDWDQAHALIDQLGDRDSAWVHAYLHRKEGDIWNADYWYARAKKTRPSYSLEEEWSNLLAYFIDRI